jgi:hypothetical protein
VDEEEYINASKVGSQAGDKPEIVATASTSLSPASPPLFQTASMKTSIFIAVASAAFVSSAPTPAVLEARAPPNIPSKATATTQLAGLSVAAQGSQTGYSRDLFPHWITQSGACNTRETVLKRDGSGVVTDSACASTSGSWYSTYDGATWTAASDVDIDHVVPLSNAWKVCLSTCALTKSHPFPRPTSPPCLSSCSSPTNTPHSPAQPPGPQPAVKPSQMTLQIPNSSP